MGSYSWSLFSVFISFVSDSLKDFDMQLQALAALAESVTQKPVSNSLELARAKQKAICKLKMRKIASWKAKDELFIWKKMQAFRASRLGHLRHQATHWDALCFV